MTRSQSIHGKPSEALGEDAKPDTGARRSRRS